jgi:hypothetical protein
VCIVLNLFLSTFQISKRFQDLKKKRDELENELKQSKNDQNLIEIRDWEEQKQKIINL